MEKEKRKQQTEVEHPDIREVEHTTPHPLPGGFQNLWDTNYSPGENTDLNEHPQNRTDQ